jgi:ribosomal protein S18 acetylase RimI-like enzyme
MGVRETQISDCPAMAHLVVDAWRWAYKGIISDEELVALDVGARLRRMEGGWDSERVNLVACDPSGDVVGFSRSKMPSELADFDAEIEALYVHPTATRGGHGRALVAAATRSLISRGAQSLAIHTLKDNRIGRGFYEKIGGRVVAEDRWRQFEAVWYGWFDLPMLVSLCAGHQPATN